MYSAFDNFVLRGLRETDDVMGQFVKVEIIYLEVGGRNKKGRQVSDIEDAFIVKDDIEFGYMNVIPLWTFGLNY